jgi:hypothetical protein
MNLAPDVLRGKARDLGYRFGVQLFQITHHHLAIQRIEPLNQCEEMIERLIAIRGDFHVFVASLGLGLL